MAQLKTELSNSGEVAQKPGQTREAGSIRRRPSPRVGFTSNANHLTVHTQADGIYCRVSTSTYVLLVAMSAVFGPMLGSFFYLRFDKLDQHTPTFILAASWFLILLSSGLFVRYALGCPRFSAIYGTGEIRYFAWWGYRPSLIFRRGEVRGLAVEEQMFLDKGTPITNYSIVVTGHEGERCALCVSTDEQLISRLKSDLEKVLVGTS